MNAQRNKTMDFFNSRYFVWNKNLQIMVGLWPYQNRIAAAIVRFTILSLLIVGGASHIIHWRKQKAKLMKTIFLGAILLFATIFGLKMLFFHAARKKKIYVQIANIYETFNDDQERKILEYNFDVGRKLTIGYVVYMVTTNVFFVGMPYCSYVTESLISANNNKLYIFEMEYFIDNKDDYYYAIYAFEASCTAILVPVYCAADTTYAVCVQSCIGLLDVIKLRLQLAMKNLNKDFGTNSHDKKSYKLLIRAIKLHQEVYEFFIILEETYSTGFLVFMGLSLFGFSVGILYILDSLSNLYNAMRSIMTFMGGLVHLFFISYPGQSLINHSSNILVDAYNTEWYECSAKNQKLLLFLAQKALKPFELTAGGMYTMNFQNVGKLIKASGSYFTVLLSIQKK